jgi:hypothetical protein
LLRPLVSSMLATAGYGRVSEQHKMVADETWPGGRGRQAGDAASQLAIRKLDTGRSWMSGISPWRSGCGGKPPSLLSWPAQADHPRVAHAAASGLICPRDFAEQEALHM